MQDNPKEAIKRIKATLQVLEIQIQNSPYNRNENTIIRKKQRLKEQLATLETLEKKGKS